MEDERGVVRIDRRGEAGCVECFGAALQLVKRIGQDQTSQHTRKARTQPVGFQHDQAQRSEQRSECAREG